MFIGQIGRNSFFNTVIAGQKQTAAAQIPFQTAAFRTDRAEIGTLSQEDSSSGIYRPSSNQMKSLEPVSFSWASPDDERGLDITDVPTLLPPSEREEYTEEDALLNQYSKQFRIEGYFEGDEFILTSEGPVRLMGDVSEEQLENFRKELIENGLGTEIDWYGVRSDMVSMNIRLENAERFGQKADYLASRYAVLKDRIQNQFTGEKQEAELQKLEQLYTEVKEEMADTYAKNIGGFYESLGQSGAADDTRESVLAMIDGKADAYAAYLAQNDIYADITEPDRQWLKQDDGYMAAKLRESASAASEQMPVADRQAPYSEKDLVYAGMYAKELSQQIKDIEDSSLAALTGWKSSDVRGDDSAIGRYLAKEYNALSSEIDSAGISDRLANLLKASFEPFIDKFLDALDAKIDHNRERVADSPWSAGLIRTEYIDRDKVYSAFGAA